MLALICGACSFWYGFVATAANPGVTMAELRDVLATDASIEITREFSRDMDRPPSSDDELVGFWAERRGATAHVHWRHRGAQLVVAVGMGGGPPSAAERKEWETYSHEVTDLLGAAFPDLGPWEREEMTEETNRRGTYVFQALAIGVLLAAVLVAVRFARRARRTGP